MTDKLLWEILVPTTIDRHGKIKPITTRYHRVWDAKVKDIAGGLTILNPTKGYWVSPDKELFVERMIPVRICCTEEEINNIADMSAKYYNQKAMMYYLISSKVMIKHY